MVGAWPCGAWPALEAGRFSSRPVSQTSLWFTNSTSLLRSGLLPVSPVACSAGRLTSLKHTFYSPPYTHNQAPYCMHLPTPPSPCPSSPPTPARWPALSCSHPHLCNPSTPSLSRRSSRSLTHPVLPLGSPPTHEWESSANGRPDISRNTLSQDSRS